MKAERFNQIKKAAEVNAAFAPATAGNIKKQVNFEICSKDTKEHIISFSAVCDNAKDIERWYNQYKRWYKYQDVRIQSIN